ncbi:MAG TPA: MgtC/SapB family protein [Kofleriaceae bacterium]|nr:MgtC/SapB family protein [Kofleriaceae bacterium]
MIDQFIGAFRPEMAFQLVLSLTLGAVVGLERELRGRSAGLRTLSLVCMGATLFMIGSHILGYVESVGGPSAVEADTTRIAAGIVTGIGFLGAGVILKLGDLIRGVTTAASIWVVAAIGFAVGMRQYALSCAATLLALVVLVVLHHFERYMHALIYRSLKIRARSPYSETVLACVRAVIKDIDGAIMDLRVEENVEEAVTELKVSIRTRQDLQGHDVVKAVAAAEGVIDVKWF